VEKLVWVLVISFCKIVIPSYVFDALECRNWLFSALNCLTLQITLLVLSLCTSLFRYVFFLKFYFDKVSSSLKGPKEKFDKISSSSAGLLL